MRSSEYNSNCLGQESDEIMQNFTQQVGSNIMKESGSQVYLYKQQTPFVEKLENFTTHDIQSSTYSD